MSITSIAKRELLALRARATQPTPCDAILLSQVAEVMVTVNEFTGREWTELVTYDDPLSVMLREEDEAL